jgi:hypothetical protein
MLALLSAGELSFAVLGRTVATSVSEWMRIHSLTLVATRKQKREVDFHRGGWSNAPEFFPRIFTGIIVNYAKKRG